MKRQAPIQRAPRSCQSGVGLIEVMVAVLVLSIGFLGIAALQAMSLSNNNSAMARSMATIDSYSILDAMRADKTNALNGSYTTTVKANNCPAAGGTLATDQINSWCTSLGNDLGALASTTGAVTCAATGACTITVSFDDSRAANAGVTTATQQTQIVTVTTQVVL